MQTRRTFAFPASLPPHRGARVGADRTLSAAFGTDNVNNRTSWKFHPCPQRTFFAELRAAP